LFAGATIAAGGQLVGRYAIHFVAMGTYQVSNVSHDERASDWLMVEIIRAGEEKSRGTSTMLLSIKQSEFTAPAPSGINVFRFSEVFL
jgi:hypothetical protein